MLLSLLLCVCDRICADELLIEKERVRNLTEEIEQTVQETLTYYTFPDIHWQKIRTNNPLERIMREIRRRTRVVGAFPDGQSCLNLAAARLRYIAGSAWSAKRYMNMRPLYQMQLIQTGAILTLTAGTLRAGVNGQIAAPDLL